MTVTMKLWLLRPTAAAYKRGYLNSDSFEAGRLVRAATAKEAREFAAEAETQYGPDYYGDHWIDPRHSTCTRLDEDGDPGVVLVEFASSECAP